MSTVHTEVLTMHLGDHVSKSYLAYPAGQESPQPGVLVIPEFWGLTDHTKNRAHNLAELGYCALALDVYGEGWVGGNAEEAAAKMNSLYADMDTTSERMKAYLEALKDLKQADETKTASIGYCLGGGFIFAPGSYGCGCNGRGQLSWQFGCSHKRKTRWCQSQSVGLSRGSGFHDSG